jgi:H+/Cl- antiporter ClcA
MFLFLSVALAKRHVEVDRHGASARRGYKAEDVRVLLPLGIGCGLMAVLVLALYIHSPEVRALYRRPEILWLMCAVVLYWIARIWLLAARGELADDPVVFALRDPASYAAGACAATVLITATFTAG